MSHPLRPLALPVRPILPVLLIALSLGLCGCWAAQNYTVQIKIDKLGNYQCFAEGLAVHIPTAMAARQLDKELKSAPGKPEEAQKRKDELMGKFKAEIATALAEKRVLVQYLTEAGIGRARFSLIASGTLGGPEIIRSQLMDPLALARHADGSITIRIKDVTPPRNASLLALKPEGDIAVTVAEGTEVLATNAMRKPSSPGGAYRWRLESASPEVPFLTIKLPAQATATH